MNPEISYLIVSFNSEKHISKCINSITNQSYMNYEVIIIDNNSNDNTISIVKDFCTKNLKIKLIQNSTNVGYGNAITIGVENSKGKFLAILNADVFLDANWSSNIMKTFSTDEKIASVSGKILFPNGEIQSAGGMMDKYGAIMQRESKVFYSTNIGDRAFFYNDGSSFMVRRQIFQETSFDSKLFLYYEDVDLSWKIRMLGYKIEYNSEAISYHDTGHSLYDMTPDKFYYLARNRIYVCQKNYSLQHIICRMLPIFFLIFSIAIFYDTHKKPTSYTKNFFKAIMWNFTNFCFMRSERKRLHKRNRISDKEIDKHLISKSIELSLI